MSDSPFDPLYDQIANLISMARDKSAQSLEGNVDPEMIKRLDVVEKMIMALNQVVQEDLDEKGITNEDLVKKIVYERDKFPVKSRKELERTLALGRDVVALKYALAMSQIKPEEKSFTVAKPQRSDVTKRKSKFKKMGNDKWKKL